MLLLAALAAALVPTPCQAGQLSAHVRQSSGAAGTIGVSIAFRNRSKTDCSLAGYPSLLIPGVQTRTRHGGLAILNAPVKRLTLRPGGYASLLVTYSDIPSGKGATSCVIARALRVSPPRMTVSVRIFRCGKGVLELRESPFIPGLRNV